MKMKRFDDSETATAGCMVERSTGLCGFPGDMLLLARASCLASAVVRGCVWARAGFAKCGRRTVEADWQIRLQKGRMPGYTKPSCPCEGGDLGKAVQSICL